MLATFDRHVDTDAPQDPGHSVRVGTDKGTLLQAASGRRIRARMGCGRVPLNEERKQALTCVCEIQGPPIQDAAIGAGTRAGSRPVEWDSRLAKNLGKPIEVVLARRPAYHADFDFYQVVFDEERSAFGLAFRGVFIGYRRGFIHALEGMPRIRDRIGATMTCPVCWEERTAEGAIGPLSCEPLFAALLKLANQPYEARFLYVCHVCIAAGRAIQADACVQHCGDDLPREAFFDVTLTCEDCQSDLRFTASEQEFWYEDLKFFAEARPKQCRRCRVKGP